MENTHFFPFFLSWILVFILNLLLFIYPLLIHSGVFCDFYKLIATATLVLDFPLLPIQKPPKTQPGHTLPLSPQPSHFTYLILDEGPSGICFIQRQEVGGTDQHSGEWEGLGKVMAAAGTPKLPREVGPTYLALLQHEVIEALLGDRALDTENTLTPLASLQPVGHNIYKFLFLFPISITVCCFTFPLCSCPALSLNSAKMLSSFISLLFSLTFFFCLASWPHGLLPQPGVVIILLQARKMQHILFCPSLICSSWFEFFKETGQDHSSY